MLRKLFIAIFFLGSVFTTPLAKEGIINPEGERALYLLDKNSRRTSGIVRTGKTILSVGPYLPGENGGQYEVSMNLDFKIDWVGRKTLQNKLNIPEVFFSEGFMPWLRKNKHFHTPDYKIVHNGMGPARTMDGSDYGQSDIITLYDIDIVAFHGIYRLVELALREQLGSDLPMPLSDIKDITIKAMIAKGNRVPVLGAAKLDIKAKAYGIAIKIGMDYSPRK